MDKFTDKLNSYLKKYFMPEVLSDELTRKAGEQIDPPVLPEQPLDDSQISED
jgi:hypothetical protein